MKKKQNKKIIISVLISLIMLFAVFSAPANAFAAEQNQRLIPVYDIYGDNYVGSDYLAEIGLFKRGFINPIFSETVETTSSDVNNQYYNITYSRLSADFASFEGTINQSNNDILIIYEAQLWNFISINNIQLVDSKICFLYYRNYNLNIPLKQLADFAFPEVPANHLQAIASLNIYLGSLENTRSSDFYPYAEDFLTLDGAYNSFLINNLDIVDFGNIYLPPFGTDFKGVGGEISYKYEYIIENSEIIGQGAYLWSEELENLEDRFEISENPTEINILSNGINYLNFYNNTNKLYYYNYDIDDITYNNGWINDNYRLLYYTYNGIIDFNYIYVEGDTDGVYFKNNVQYLAVATKIQGYTDSYVPPENVFENIIDSVGEFFGNIGSFIENIFVGSVNLVSQIIDYIGGILSNFNNFIENVTSNPLPWFALLAIVGIVILTIYIIFNNRRNN